MKVLIIDDEPLVLQTFGHAVSHGGWTVFTHDQYADCAKLIAEHGIDVLLTDYQMPTMNGLDLIEQLRRAGIGIPVVMMSANGYAIDPLRAELLGIFKIIPKPITLKELLSTLMDAVTNFPDSIKEIPPP